MVEADEAAAAEDEDDVERITSPDDVEELTATVEELLDEDDDKRSDDVDDEDGLNDELELLRLELEGVEPHAGRKTHMQPLVQFSPSSSHTGTVQPRPQVGSS